MHVYLKSSPLMMVQKCLECATKLVVIKSNFPLNQWTKGGYNLQKANKQDSCWFQAQLKSLNMYILITL